MAVVPDKIKLADGTEIVVKDNPEVEKLIKQAIQDARKEEKDKLYSQIATLETAKKTLENEKVTFGELTAKQKKDLEAVNEELATLKAEKKKLEEEGKKKPETEPEKGGATTTGLTKEDVIELLEGFSKKQSDEFEKKLSAVQGDLSSKKVSDYREKAIAKYDGLLIEDFVPTNLNTPEEVDKAIETALLKSKKYLSKEYEIDGKKQKMTIEEYEELTKEKETGAGGQGGTTTYEPKEPAKKPDQGTGGDLTGKELLSKVEDMTDEEYAKYHSQILKEAKTLQYNGSAGE